MSNTPFQRDNHYVPCVYLDAFKGPDKKIATYRLLVSHPKVPLWKFHSVRGIAYHSHLYTRMTAGGLSDEFEKWLEHEYETPAAPALQRAVTDDRLSPEDWQHLVRFAAAQDVRTPARLLESMQRWSSTLPALLDEVVRESVQRLELAKKAGTLLSAARNDGNSIPLRISTEVDPEKEFGTLKAELIAGRELWLYSIKRLLTDTANVLLQHRWSIVKPPKGIKWFTSDDPVIRLNYYGPENYDFKGGWGRQGTEILLPLSPTHLLCTRVGERYPRRRGDVLPATYASMIHRFVAEHAHRMILAAAPDEKAVKLRRRAVDKALYEIEAERWRKWHEEQIAAARKLMNWQISGTT
jgi:Protein of unknown function (DUF4238)